MLPLGIAFVTVERRLEAAGRHPLVAPSLLRNRGMRAGLVIAALFFAGFAAFMFVSAIALQTGAHLSPLGSGMALVPLALAFFAASLFTARLTERYGRSVVAAGALIQSVGPDLGGGDARLGVAARRRGRARSLDGVAGVGQGLVVSPLFGFVLAGVPADRAGVGSGDPDDDDAVGARARSRHSRQPVPVARHGALAWDANRVRRRDRRPGRDGDAGCSRRARAAAARGASQAEPVPEAMLEAEYVEAA